MSTSDNNVQFKATALDDAAELFVIDSKMDMVARGIGALEALLAPGVYKLKVRAGHSTHEELVVLRDKPVVRTVERLQIPSAAPFEQTAQSHEYHQHAAAEESRKPTVQVGQGASIFVFARDWTPDDQPSVSGHHPAESLTLRSVEGPVLVDFETQSHIDLSKDPYAACRVEVNPGPYRLTVTAPSGTAFEMLVVAHMGWQTQVFLLQREDRKWYRGRRPDLGSASVIMARRGFDAKDDEDRLAELARLALVDRRKVLSPELNSRLLHQKFENPMLGIIGAHLILRQEKPDRTLLKTVISNLRTRIFGNLAHPDVEALALAAGEEALCDFAIPPMLRASWEIVVEHSFKERRLVPEGSLAARMAAGVTNQDPWLIWRTPDERVGDWTQDIADNLRAILKSASAKRRRRVGALETASRDVLGSWSGFERLLESSADVSRMTTLAQSIGLPPATVSHMIRQAAGATAVKKTLRPAAGKPQESE